MGNKIDMAQLAAALELLQAQAEAENGVTTRKAKQSAKPKKAEAVALPTGLAKKIGDLRRELTGYENQAASYEAKKRGVEAVGYVQYTSGKRFLVTETEKKKYQKRSGYRELN